MEFPSLGEHCQYENCNAIDFLPMQCNKCSCTFCRTHFLEHCLSNSACKLTPSEEISKTNDQIYRCSADGCRKGSLLEMLCSKCSKHFCVDHRFHLSCPEIDDEIIKYKKEQIEIPRRQFQEANKDLDKKITENIRRAMQSSTKIKTAAKIHLMRVKQKAIGPKTVPLPDRAYFSIVKPKTVSPKPIKTVQDCDNKIAIDVTHLDPDLKNSVPVFISRKWTLGRAIDSICETCAIVNENNKICKNKVRLFRQLDFYCVSPLIMDIEISDLLKQEILVEGDRLLLEYITIEDLERIDNNTQIFLNM